MTTAPLAEVGQVWEDRKSSRAGRSFCIMRIEEGILHVLTLTKPGGEPIPSYLQNVSRISQKNLTYAKGYQLVEDQS